MSSDVCKYCGSDELVETLDNVACRDCGSEQGLQQFVNGIDTVNHVAPFTYTTTCAGWKVWNDMTRVAQTRLNIPDSVITSALEMLDDYSKINTTKGFDNKEALVYAAIYFVSKDTQYPRTRKNIVEQGCISGDLFTQAVSAIKEVLATSRWNQVLQFSTAAANTNTIGSEVNRTIYMLGFPKHEVQQIRNKLSKLQDKVADMHALQNCHPSTLAAALTFIAIMAAKLDSRPPSLKKVAAAAGVSAGSLINIRNVIISNIRGSSKSA